MLLGLAVLGQGVHTWLTLPNQPPGQLTILPPDSTDPLSRQRELAKAVDRPLAAGEKIDVDRATVDEIARLPRVGRGLAKAIVADRTAHGPFGSLAALDRVSGVGPGLLQVVAPHAAFSGTGVYASPPGAPNGPPPLDLNAADSAGLERLSGIGPYMAARIVAYRTRHGPFGTPDDLLKVGGIGPATLARIRDQVRVGQ
jgi:competence ComEA-like helix-hairpin-helix protein